MDPVILLLEQAAEIARLNEAACTGLIFESGLDNGDGSGTANDGILQSGEVDDSTIWCN